MGQTVNKRRWIPFIAAMVAFLVFAMHDSLLYGMLYLESFVQNKTITMCDWTWLFACIEGLLVFTALVFTAYDKKTPAIVLACINVLIAVIPMFYSSNYSITSDGQLLSCDPLRRIGLIYSVIFVLANACIIAYHFTKTASVWRFAPLGLMLLGVISIIITFVLSCYYIQGNGSTVFQADALWRDFGGKLKEFVRTPKWWFIPVSLKPLINHAPLPYQAIGASVYPISIGLLFLVMAAGLSVNPLSLVKKCANDSQPHLRKEEVKMNMTFKAPMQKEWTLNDDHIIFGRKRIELSEIYKAKHSPIASGASNGVITIEYGDSLFGFATLAYPKSQEEDGIRAAKYILAVVRGEDPNTEMKKLDSIKQHGYRKICSVCGHIFCYTQEDIENNRQLIKRAQQSLNVGIVNVLAGYGNSGSTEKQTAEDLMNRVVDYSKCPKCGSKEITDATDEDIAKSKQAQGTIIQQASAADEIKKFKELLDMGVISQEEFDAKKKQLLGL